MMFKVIFVVVCAIRFSVIVDDANMTAEGHLTLCISPFGIHFMFFFLRRA